MSVGIVTIGLLLFPPVTSFAEEKDDPSDARVIAKVGDQEIRFGDLNKWIMMMPPSYRAMFKNPEQMKKLLERQINNILFSEEAKRLKLDQKPDVKDKIEEFTKGILMQALIEEKINTAVTVTPKEIEEYYNSNQDEFKTPERIKVRRILIEVDPDASEADEKKKKEEAEKILKQVKAGEDFPSLAKQYSEDVKTKNKGGLVGFFTKGSKDPAFEEAAFKLKKDEVSPLVRTKQGFEIIQFLDKKEAATKTLNEATSRIENKLKQQKRTEAVETLLEDLKAKTPIVVNDDVLTKIVEEQKGK
jgi:parvulin-like peptidyl-prolyl isomerase